MKRRQKGEQTSSRGEPDPHREEINEGVEVWGGDKREESSRTMQSWEFHLHVERRWKGAGGF